MRLESVICAVPDTVHAHIKQLNKYSSLLLTELTTIVTTFFTLICSVLLNVCCKQWPQLPQVVVSIKLLAKQNRNHQLCITDLLYSQNTVAVLVKDRHLYVTHMRWVWLQQTT